MEDYDRSKILSYDQLYELDRIVPDAQETCEVAPLLKRSRKSVTGRSRLITPAPALIPARLLGLMSHSSPGLLRTSSEPLLNENLCTSRTEDVSVVKETPLHRMKDEDFQSSSLVTSSPASTLNRKRSGPFIDNPRMTGKRKRVRSLQMMPESQQIFKGLSFYFFPNDDTAPARRMRIAKALEYGAVWVKDWRPNVTHIVVDRGLNYIDLISFLKLDSLPPETVLINEFYPADCISFQLLINPKQAQYQVDGHLDAPTTDHRSFDTEQRSEISLPLKAAKEDLAKAQITPLRSEESTAEALTDIAIAENCLTDNCTRITVAKGDTADALEQAIIEARAFKDLPLDSDDDPEESGSLASGGYDSDDNEKEQKLIETKKRPLNKSWQQDFICMEKHDGVSKNDNPNARTIEVLQEMADYYSRIKDTWRPIAYRKAISTLGKQTHKVTTKDEASSLSHIGERLALKIEEIVWTNRLRRLDSTKLEPADEVLERFLNIYGVGYAVASKWVNQGYKTLSDLLQRAHLTENQRIGISHYEDFLSRIPRAEVEAHGAAVRKTALALDPDLEIHIMGSYRRGAADCGDIDIVITKPGAPIYYLRSLLIESIVPKLFREGFLKAALASTSRLSGTKWHGASALPSTHVWRRIDFLLVPWEELGAALIYFTGNDIFNRSIRLLASKKGMRLNQRGLWRDVIRGQNQERITQGSLIEGQSEKRIFELLGVPWRPPEHRIC